MQENVKKENLKNYQKIVLTNKSYIYINLDYCKDLNEVFNLPDDYVVIYVRQSEDKKKKTESDSISSQIDMSIEYCLTKGYKLKAIFVDEDNPASDKKQYEVKKYCQRRTSFWAFMEKVYSKDLKGFKKIICYDLSRFARYHQAPIMGLLAEFGVKVETTNDVNEEDVRHFIYAKDSFHSASLSKKVKDNLNNLFKKGRFMGNCPTGYRYKYFFREGKEIADKRKWEIYKPNADKIIQTAELKYKKGFSWSEVKAEIEFYYVLKNAKWIKQKINSDSILRAWLSQHDLYCNGVVKFGDIKRTEPSLAFMPKELCKLIPSHQDIGGQDS